MTRLYRLSIATVLSTYLLIVFGGITRISGSGMGCEDNWPLCQGKPYPPLNALAIVEYLHRTFAFVVVVLVIATAIGAWKVRGTSKRTRVAATVGIGFVFFQAFLGAITVWWKVAAWAVTSHLGTAMAFFAVTLLTAYFIALDRGAPAWVAQAGRAPDGDTAALDPGFRRVAQAGALVIFLLMLTGAYTSTSGAALACDSWPLCHGTSIIPARHSGYTFIQMGHRTAALIGTLTVAAVALEARRRRTTRAARRLTALAAGTILVQVFIGAAYVISFGVKWLSGVHLATAAALWATMVVLVLVTRNSLAGERGRTGAWTRSPRAAGAGAQASTQPQTQAQLQMSAAPGPAPVSVPVAGPAVAGELPSPLRVQALVGEAALTTPMALSLRPRLPSLRLGHARGVIGDYLTLTKPGILTLLLATTLGAMLVAVGGLPPLGLVLATLVGGTLAAGGANVLNCYVDRDIDARMRRTSQRATAAGRISPRAALTFGVVVTVASVLVLGFLANWLAAGLALAGNLYYVFVYTKWLKRRTPHNIVIGGAAGAMPPLVGWAAVTGHLSAAAVVLFAIIYYWTPPHFWALALLKQGDYGRAEVPMLPVVAGEHETRRQMLLYTGLLSAVCLLLIPLGLGVIYAGAAIALNAVFVGMALRLFRSPSKRLARRLFMYSLWYLALIYAAMVADRLLL